MKEGCAQECPGCAHRDWSAEASSAQKLDWLRKRLNPWKDQIEDLRTSLFSRWGYRGKTCLRAEWDEFNHCWKLGLRIQKGVSERGRKLFDLISIPDCPIHTEFVRRVIRAFSENLSQDLPLVFVAVSGKIATLVLKTAQLPDFSKVFFSGSDFNPELLGLEAIWINLNPSAGERVFSSRGWHLFWEKGRSSVELEIEKGQNVSFFYGAESFQQLIPSLYLDAIHESARFFNLKKDDRVVDLCSGIGISIKKWQIAGAESLGVELNGDAVKNAKENAGSESCIQGRVSDRIPQIEAWRDFVQARTQGVGKDVVFANPPRLGLEPEVSAWLAHRFCPNAIAYLSCSAGTLARDLSILEDARYCVKRIIPYDFFPQTPHVETLTFLERMS